MPTKRTRRTHTMISEDISPVALHFLTDGASPLPEDSAQEVCRWKMSKTDRESTLERYSVQIIKLWINEFPGTRPSWWWARYAPEPQRRRLGGIGTPSHECLSVVAHYRNGIPASFVDPWSVEYYNGRARDIHGNPIGTEYRKGDFKGVAINPDNPPQYESQAAFLKRHGLLTPVEKRRLKRRDFEPKTIEPE